MWYRAERVMLSVYWQHNSDQSVWPTFSYLFHPYIVQNHSQYKCKLYSWMKTLVSVSVWRHFYWFQCPLLLTFWASISSFPFLVFFSQVSTLTTSYVSSNASSVSSICLLSLIRLYGHHLIVYRIECCHWYCDYHQLMPLFGHSISGEDTDLLDQLMVNQCYIQFNHMFVTFVLTNITFVLLFGFIVNIDVIQR